MPHCPYSFGATTRFNFGTSLEQSPALIKAKIELTKLIGGKDAFYAWSTQIPAHIVLSEKRYIEEIQAKIKELRTQQ